MVDKVADMERRYSLRELQAMARQRGVSASGTKRVIAKRLITAAGKQEDHVDKAVRSFQKKREGDLEKDLQEEIQHIFSVPMTMDMSGSTYSWQYLLGRPYGTSVWDIMLVNGQPFVTFMAREETSVVKKLPDPLDVYWKAISMGMVVNNRKVMPVIVMADVLPLDSMYEVWFNFYGEAQDIVQEAFALLAQQSHLFLFFLDKTPEPVRKIAFPNSIAHFFRGHQGMLKALPPWNDDDYDEAKRRIMRDYSPDQLWSLR